MYRFSGEMRIWKKPELKSMEDMKLGIRTPLIHLHSELYIENLVYYNSDIENLHKTYTLINSPPLNLFSTLGFVDFSLKLITSRCYLQIFGL
jgi:hypothetical protein